MGRDDKNGQARRLNGYRLNGHQRPMGICPHCTERIYQGEPRSRVIVWGDAGGVRPHFECGLREVLGGIGHLIDHGYWCDEVGDPDMGLSYRESAARVAEYVSQHGVEAAIRAKGKL